jgi:hypothetical protein
VLVGAAALLGGACSPGGEARRSPERRLDGGAATRGGDRGAAPRATGAPDRPLEIVALGRFEAVQHLADRSVLGRALAGPDGAPPPGVHALVTRVTEGPGGHLAFRYHALGETPFVDSFGRYYPASTVKLLAVVGALVRLGRLGLTGAAQIRFDTGEVQWSGTVRDLYRLTLLHGSNPAFDRLMWIAGFDELNRDFLQGPGGIPRFALQKSLFGDSLRYSPPIWYEEGERRGVIPPRWGTYVPEGCPRNQNCVTLLGLQEVLRRLVLHERLPAAERFAVSQADVDVIRGVLRQYRSRIAPGLESAIGPGVEVTTTIGYVPGYHLLESSRVVSRARPGEEWLVTLAMPLDEAEQRLPEGERALADLARRALAAVVAAPEQPPALGPDAGAPVAVAVVPAPGGPARIEISAAGAHRVEVTVDRRAPAALARVGDRFIWNPPADLRSRAVLGIRVQGAGSRFLAQRTVAVSVGAHDPAGTRSTRP